MTRTPQSVARAYEVAALAVVDKAVRGARTRLFAFDCSGRQYVERIGLLEARRAESGSGSAPIVDKESGTIKGASIATIGPARGHGFNLDALSLQQIRDGIKAAGPGGVKSHWSHAPIETATDENGDTVRRMKDSLGTLVGRVFNPRIVGRSLLGDVQLSAAASVLPGVGNARDYLLALAEDDPSACGLSTVFAYEVEPTFDSFGELTGLVARISRVDSVDFVDAPAANPHGLAGSLRARRPVHRVSRWNVTADAHRQRDVVQGAAAYAPRIHGYASLSQPRIGARDKRDAMKLLAFLHRKIRDVAEDLLTVGRVDVL